MLSHLFSEEKKVMKYFSFWPDVWLLAHTHLEEWFGSTMKPIKDSYFLLILEKTSKLIQIFLPDTFEPYFQVKDSLTSFNIFFGIQTCSLSISTLGSGLGVGLLRGAFKSKNADLSITFWLFWRVFGGHHLWKLTLLHVESPNLINWIDSGWKKGYLKLDIIIFYTLNGDSDVNSFLMQTPKWAMTLLCSVGPESF